MADTSDTTAPLEASATGANRYMLACPALGQRMSYAACLNRLQTIKTGVGVPKDWSECDRACTARQCPAQHMREDEVVAGHALYFVPRGVIQAAADSARKWISSWNNPKPKALRGRRDVLDAIGEVGDYASAINAEPRKPVVLPVANAGETPLQMARRLAAERKSTT
jgi:hypothetical protein